LYHKLPQTGRLDLAYFLKNKANHGTISTREFNPAYSSNAELIMQNLPPKWRDFLDDARWFINAALILALINLFTFFTSDNPALWSLIPIFFMSLWLIPGLIDTLLGNNEEEDVDEASEPAHLSENRVTSVHLDKAYAYKQQIDTFIQDTSNPHTRQRLQELSSQLGEWIQAIEAMAHHVARFQQNPLIHQDLESLPQTIDKLKTQLAAETDEVTRAELERTLAKREDQLALLERLQSRMRRAEIKIEDTLASIGIIYSQLLTGDSTNHMADYSRLSEEVNEEVRTLQDHLEALEEVKLGR
jgi:hypothetical protein